MKRTIYLNFNDLSDETKDEIISIAKNNILEEEKDDIIKEHGAEHLEEVVSEKIDHELLNINFVFNI